MANIKKKSLLILSPWEDFNQAISVSTNFVDSLVNSWSVGQSSLMFKQLSTENTNKELAKELGESQQNINKKLSRTQADNVRLYLEYFASKIRDLTNGALPD